MKTLKVVKEKIGRKGRGRKLTIEGAMSGHEAKSRGVPIVMLYLAFRRTGFYMDLLKSGNNKDNKCVIKRKED